MIQKKKNLLLDFFFLEYKPYINNIHQTRLNTLMERGRGRREKMNNSKAKAFKIMGIKPLMTLLLVVR